MGCPKCRRELNLDPDSGIASCERCGGMYVPIGVFDELIEGSEDYDDGLPEEGTRAGDLLDYLRMNGRKIVSDRDCPSCGERLVRKAYAAFQGMSLDFCWPCVSIWFDHGEFERVAAFDETDPEGSGTKKAPKKLRVIKAMGREINALRETAERCGHSRAGRGAQRAADHLAHYLGRYRSAKAKARRRRKRRESGEGA